MQENELKRGIGMMASLATVMGTVIGGGVFFKTASVVQSTHSFTLTILAWIIGGLLTICAGLTVSELAAAIPKTGGAIKYLDYTYGPLTGFSMGWAQILVYYPANIAAESIVFSTQIINLFHLNGGLLNPIAIGCALSILIINLLGSKVSGNVQTIALVFKLIPIFIIAIIGLFIPGEVNVSLFPISPINHDSLWTAFGAGLLATMFAYDGWIGVCDVAGEIKNPKKNLPKAIILGLSFITIIYTLINVVFLKTLPIDQIAGNQNTASEAAIKLFGDLGGKLVTIGILVSVYGSLNGYTLSGMRIPYAMGKSKSLPFSNAFTKLTKKTLVPYVAGLFQLFIAILMIFAGSFDLLTDMLVFVMWIFNCLLFIAVFRLRRKEPEMIRPYKVPWYPIIPIIALVGGIFILFETIISQTGLALIGILLTVLGIPVYYLQQRHLKNNG
ncbi:APC family permease [Apilactobacillus timberlakei]|uniref:APC family permease n=1 Tax=Apilactobacillus timberlakei TaxID=2008380 RepID=UPI001127809B|nr:amino acid permease [Apilactobacillus timberlakei]TPR17299.1 amino acid permease [Apilactobacillus timberlakei]TPR18394.1 amino acid permease [Apilactobacillus timberlakei]TPR18604.1 amino acid permease [Apilactobacillus timberlakei]TPR20685.1 amino acid permease [Apilactobacillus timberlakei]TPR21317.1 amino acid permease [Apilactobacillus timberlakei]